MTNEIYAGKIEVKSIKVTNVSGAEYDITTFVPEINIYEDLTSNFISGTLVISDTGALINQVGIIGQEKIQFELQSPGMESTIILTFFLSKLDNVRPVTTGQNSYLIHFVSYDALKNQLKRVSKSYKGKITDIVRDVYKTNLGSSLGIEESKSSIQFISPYWTPFETLNWLANKTIDKFGIPSYICYANMVGVQYRSLTSLYQDVAAADYYVRPIDISHEGIPGFNKYKYQMETVKDFRVVENFNFLESLSRGLLSGELYIKDLTQNQFSGSSFNYLKRVNTFPHLNTVNLIPETNSFGDKYRESKSERRVATIQSQIFDKYPSSSNVEHYALQRMSFIESIGGTKIQLRVPGHLTLNVGIVVNLSIPMSGSQDKQKLDPTMSGRYLVTAVRHIISGKTHEVVLELSKDSFTDKVK